MSRPDVTRQRLNGNHPLRSDLYPFVGLPRSYCVMMGLLLVPLLVSCSSLPAESEEIYADELALEPVDAVVIGVGHTMQFRAIPQTGSGKPVPGYLISWTSADESIATQRVHVEAI